MGSDNTPGTGQLGVSDEVMDKKNSVTPGATFLGPIGEDPDVISSAQDGEVPLHILVENYFGLGKL